MKAQRRRLRELCAPDAPVRSNPESATLEQSDKGSLTHSHAQHANDEVHGWTTNSVVWGWVRPQNS